ncbi:hypothetical protein A3Q56_00524 [Intoshia linei]|uniref:Major facilitator superfamily (MFS) profile domain-containing protein n=1 Tax=Intoshia linei TaxID=1819745 RepID=A0A177BBI3_9BILA|nr:hypothetical protein A3Q56_00524 [Intoshia linei]
MKLKGEFEDFNMDNTVVMLAGLVFYMIADGWSYSLSIIFQLFQKKFDVNNSKVYLFITIVYAVPCISSVFVCILIKKTSFQFCAFLGSAIFSISLLLYHTMYSWTQLIISINIIGSIGLSLYYLVAYLNVVHSFDKNRGLALGITTLGSPIGGTIFPYILNATFNYHANHYMYIIGGVILTISLITSMAFTSKNKLIKSQVHSVLESENNEPIEHKEETKLVHIISFFHLSIFKNFKLDIYLISLFLAYLFISNGFVYVYQHLEISIVPKPEEYITKLITIVISLMSVSRGCGQVLFGILSDRCRISTFYLLGLCFVGLSICFILMGLTSSVYLLSFLYIVYALLFSSVYIIPIFNIGKLVNQEHVNHVFSYQLAFNGIGMLIGAEISSNFFKFI